MGYLNKIMLIGNVGGDAEERVGASSNFATFSICTSETYKGKNGEKVTNSEWHDVVAFGKLSDICLKYVKKGTKVYVEGKLTTRKWQANDGEERESKSVVCNDMRLLYSKDSANNNNSRAEAKEEYSDDIPF